MFKLPKLEFDPAKLEGISAETIELHHNVIHRGYVDTLNALTKGTELENFDLGVLIEWLNAQRRHNHDPRVKDLFHAACQHFAHSFMWDILGPEGECPFDASTIECLTDESSRLFGGGWVWIIPDLHSLDYEWAVVAKRGTGIPPIKPLFVIDVWEHAYYLDAKTDRSLYIRNYLASVNWNRVKELISEIS